MAAKWFLDDEDHLAAARELLRRREDGALSFAAPDCFYYEFGNVIRTAERRSPRRISPARADQVVADILILPMSIAPSRLLLPRAVERSRGHDVSVYDAFYLVVAEMLGATFVTADVPLHEPLRTLPYVRRLDQLT